MVLPAFKGVGARHRHQKVVEGQALKAPCMSEIDTLQSSTEALQSTPPQDSTQVADQEVVPVPLVHTCAILQLLQAPPTREMPCDSLKGAREQMEHRFAALLAGQVPSIFKDLLQGGLQATSSELSPEHLLGEIICVSNNHCSSYHLSFISLAANSTLYLWLTCFSFSGHPFACPHLPVGVGELEQIPLS